MPSRCEAQAVSTHARWCKCAAASRRLICKPKAHPVRANFFGRRSTRRNASFSRLQALQLLGRPLKYMLRVVVFLMGRSTPQQPISCLAWACPTARTSAPPGHHTNRQLGTWRDERLRHPLRTRVGQPQLAISARSTLRALRDRRRVPAQHKRRLLLERVVGFDAELTPADHQACKRTIVAAGTASGRTPRVVSGGALGWQPAPWSALGARDHHEPQGGQGAAGMDGR